MKPLLSVIACALAALALISAAGRGPSGVGSAWPRGASGRDPARIVFVSRSPAADAAVGGVPGLGPHHRAIAPGGRLMVADGMSPPRPVEVLVRDRSPFHDVSDPSVSPDRRVLAFAATAHPDSGWRLHYYVADEGLAPEDFMAGFGSWPIPRARVPRRYDDLDPCWLDGMTLVFASTRDGWRSQYDGSPVTQLYRYDGRDHSLTRLTAERNGAEEPAVDPRTGRIVYSRWWFNRARADSAAGDTVNVWQAISISPDGSDPRVVGSVSGERRLSSLYQPAIAHDGSIFGVVGDAPGLSPVPGACEITVRSHSSAPPRHLAGARFDPEDTPRYGGTRGLASPSACSPRPTSDGRVLYSLDPGGRGDYGIWISDRDGRNARPLIDLPGTLELDAVVWDLPAERGWKAPRAPAPVIALPDVPPLVPADLARWPHRFRFTNRDVFGAGFGSREAAAARAASPVRIRFWASLPRPDSPHGDTLVLVREAPVSPRGRVDERDLPAGIPMFEQLVDARGRVLRSAHVPAHVAGYNVGLPGRTSSCVGCHRGHSTAR